MCDRFRDIRSELKCLRQRRGHPPILVDLPNPSSKHEYWGELQEMARVWFKKGECALIIPCSFMRPAWCLLKRTLRPPGALVASTTCAVETATRTSSTPPRCLFHYTTMRSPHVALWAGRQPLRLTFLANEHLANLGHLQVLNLSRNELRELPSALGKLCKLQHLVISK